MLVLIHSVGPVMQESVARLSWYKEGAATECRPYRDHSVGLSVTAAATTATATAAALTAALATTASTTAGLLPTLSASALTA